MMGRTVQKGHPYNDPYPQNDRRWIQGWLVRLDYYSVLVQVVVQQPVADYAYRIVFYCPDYLWGVRCQSCWTVLSSHLQSYVHQYPSGNEWHCHWPDSRSNDNTACLGRRGMKVIFPDGKDSSLNKYAQSFLTSHVDQSNRQCRFDPEFDQSYAVELP